MLKGPRRVLAYCHLVVLPCLQAAECLCKGPLAAVAQMAVIKTKAVRMLLKADTLDKWKSVLLSHKIGSYELELWIPLPQMQWLHGKVPHAYPLQRVLGAHEIYGDLHSGMIHVGQPESFISAFCGSHIKMLAVKLVQASDVAGLGFD